MKLSPFVFFTSAILNVAAIGLLISGAFSPDSVTPASSTLSAAASSTQTKTAAGETKPADDAWSQVQSENLSAQRDRLTAEGFPPSLIRAILAAQISEGFSARRKAIENARANAPFWKNSPLDPQTQSEARALAREEQLALREVLGPDPDNYYLDRIRRQVPGLPPDKIDQLAAIQERFDQQRQDFSASIRGGNMLPDERETYAGFDKAMHAEIASVLTPSELEDYDLRMSNVSSNLRYNLTAFDMTEQEFRTLYRLQAAFEERTPPVYGQMTQEQSRARSDAQKQLTDDIKTTLGPDRYAEYERANDYYYRQTTQLVARLELPPATADSLYALQKEYQTQRLPALSSNRNMTLEQRNQLLGEVGSEVQARITAIIGEKGYAAYKQYGGSWLQSFQPQTPPAPRN